MEIYKLNELDDTKKPEFRITELKQGMKNPNRVNVFVNSKYEFSLDITQIVDFRIKVGLIISEEQLLEYKKASEFGKLYQRALEKALTRPHSEKEIYDYLYKKIYEKKLDKNYLGDIISRLTARGYLDDAKFARWYVENRFVKKGVSQKRLKMELMKKGISQDIINEAIGTRDDTEEILKIIAKKRAKYDDEKLIAYLCRQGFSWQLASELVRSYEKD